MNVDVEAALDYPRRGEDVVERYLIAGGIPSALTFLTAVVAFFGLFIPPVSLLNVFVYPFLLAVGVLWLGYFVRVVRRTLDGAADPPALDDLGDLLREGAYGMVVNLLYAVPLVVVLVGGFGLAILLTGGVALTDPGTEGAVAAIGVLWVVVFLVLTAVYLLYSLVYAYLFPASLVVYADTGDLRAAFSVDRVKPLAFDSDYLLAWLLAFVGMTVVQSVVGFLTSVLIGFLLYPLLPFAVFYLGTAAFHVFALVYGGRSAPAYAPGE